MRKIARLSRYGKPLTRQALISVKTTGPQEMPDYKSLSVAIDRRENAKEILDSLIEELVKP